MSKFFSLNSFDFIKSILVAFGTSFLTGLVQILQNGTLPTLVQIKTMAIAGAAAGISYIIKNLFTNSKNQIGKPE